MAEPRERVPEASEGTEPIHVTWRNSLFGIGTAICFAISAIFIRNGLEAIPSPLLGVTVGMVITTLAYGVLLLLRRKQIHQGPIPRDAWLFQVAAGVFVGLSTWARWIALDMAPVAVVMTLGRMNVPVVIFMAPLLVGRKAERVTLRVWLGAGLIIAGAVLLNLSS
jgi:transporter family protein